MINFLFVIIAIISTLAVGILCARKGVIDAGGKISFYKKCDDEIVPFKGKALILITIICFVIALAVQISLYKNTAIVNFIKLYGLLLILICAGIIDYKRRIIPNSLIIFGLIFRTAIYIYEIFKVEGFKDIIINDLIGFAIGFVFLGLVSFLTKGALGFGDAKLFGIIGITGGSFCTYSTLLVSLIISSVFAIVNIARKKMGRKDTFPFGPCITVGYVIAVLLTSY